MIFLQMNKNYPGFKLISMLYKSKRACNYLKRRIWKLEDKFDPIQLESQVRNSFIKDVSLINDRLHQLNNQLDGVRKIAYEANAKSTTLLTQLNYLQKQQLQFPGDVMDQSREAITKDMLATLQPQIQTLVQTQVESQIALFNSKLQEAIQPFKVQISQTEHKYQLFQKEQQIIIPELREKIIASGRNLDSMRQLIAQNQSRNEMRLNESIQKLKDELLQKNSEVFVKVDTIQDNLIQQKSELTESLKELISSSNNTSLLEKQIQQVDFVLINYDNKIGQIASDNEVLKQAIGGFGIQLAQVLNMQHQQQDVVQLQTNIQFLNDQFFQIRNLLKQDLELLSNAQ